MLKRAKALPAKEARVASEKGGVKQTNKAINNCIETLNRHIEVATAAGEYSAHTWFHNNSGFLTLNAMNIIANHFREAGYSVTMEKTENDPVFVEEYFIELDWEDTAC